MSKRLKLFLSVAGILFAATSLVSAAGLAQTGHDNDACLTTTPGFEVISRIERGAVNDLEVSPDGSMLAIASSRGIWLYSAAALELQSSLLLPDETGVASVSWSPDSRKLAAGYTDGIRIWNIGQGKIDWWDPKIPDVTHVAWSPADYRLAVLNTGFVFEGMRTIIYSDLRVVEPYTDHVLMRQTNILGNSNQVIWSPDGSRLLYLNQTSGFPGGDTDADYVPLTVLPSVWSEFEAGELQINEDPFPLQSIAFSPDGARIAFDLYEVGTGAGEVQIRDASGVMIQTLPAGSSPVWSADGSRFAVHQDNADRGFRIWDGALENDHFIPADQAWQFVLSPDGTRLYAEQWGMLVAYDTSDGKIIASLDLHPHQQLEAAWSSDATLLATRFGNDPAGNATVFIWNASGELLQRITTDSTINSIYWSPAENRLALAKSKTVEIHSLSADQPLVIEAKEPFRLAWSPDGSQLAAVLKNGDVYVWDASTGETLKYAPSPVENLSGTANSGHSRIVWTETDGLRWLLRDWDDLTRIFSPDQAEPIADLGAPDFLITDGLPEFLPDGRLYYTLRDGMTNLYDVAAGEILETFHIGADISQVALSPLLGCYATFGLETSPSGQSQISLRMKRLDDASLLNSVTLPAAVENTYRSGAVAWSPDGARVAIILKDGTLLLWGLPLKSA